MTVLEARAGDRERMSWVQKGSGCPGGPQARALGLKRLRTHCRTASGPIPGPLVGGWLWGDCGPYLQNQLPGRRGHEDAVAPGGASGVHVPLALAGVLAVRVAAGTQGAWLAAGGGPTSHCALRPRGGPCVSSHDVEWPAPRRQRDHVDVSRTQSQTRDPSSHLNFSYNGSWDKPVASSRTLWF